MPLSPREGILTLDERSRHLVRGRLDDALGPEAAELVMDELTFLDRQQRARSHDIELLRHEMAAGFAELRGEFQTGLADLRAELHEQLNVQTRRLGMWLFGAVVTVAGMNVGAVVLG